MIKGIAHVAIAVKNIDEAMEQYSNAFGFKKVPVVTVADQGVKSAVIPVGNSHIELIEPIDPAGGVAKFIETRGEGIHHVSFEVDNVDDALNSIAAKGVQLIDKKARKGTTGLIGFLHPKSTRGVLIELSQED
ncbi:MAG: methylmalonyl-CoA epimerase [Dehalococcoidia bacterium]|nr:methylmalonyl-CoA epimerase [Dehalococcoidia bacterium]MDZ4246132.1 methylmalonyl-CoA epimerase [Dehalococcoidia bacterium]